MCVGERGECVGGGGGKGGEDTLIKYLGGEHWHGYQLQGWEEVGRKRGTVKVVEKGSHK